MHDQFNMCSLHVGFLQILRGFCSVAFSCLFIRCKHAAVVIRNEAAKLRVVIMPFAARYCTVQVFHFLVCVRSGGVSGCMAEAAWRAARRVPTRSPDAPTLRADDEPGVSQLKQVLQQKHQKYLGFCPCLRLSVSASYFHMPRVLTIGFFSSAFSGCPNHPL